jgi:hypothetical protein
MPAHRPQDDERQDHDPEVGPQGLDPSEQALQWVLPLNVSGWAVASGYLGLLSCFPIVGALCGLLAVILGVLALSHLRRNPRATGAVRAWIGILLGGIMLLVQTGLIVLIIVGWVQDATRHGPRRSHTGRPHLGQRPYHQNRVPHV